MKQEFPSEISWWTTSLHLVEQRFGENPTGVITYTPDGRMSLFIIDPKRKPSSGPKPSDAEAQCEQLCSQFPPRPMTLGANCPQLYLLLARWCSTRTLVLLAKLTNRYVPSKSLETPFVLLDIGKKVPGPRHRHLPE